MNMSTGAKTSSAEFDYLNQGNSHRLNLTVCVFDFESNFILYLCFNVLLRAFTLLRPTNL